MVPLDRDTITASVRRTGRLIVVDLAPGMCGIASEVSATVVEAAFEHLRGPILRITAPDIPVPFSPALEPLMYPRADAIIAAARRLVGSQIGTAA